MSLPQLTAPGAPSALKWRQRSRKSNAFVFSAYVVEIFDNASENRISTNRLQGVYGSNLSDMPPQTIQELSDKPIATVERRFNDFVDLRSDVYNAAFDAHIGSRNRNNEQQNSLNGSAVQVEAQQPSKAFNSLLRFLTSIWTDTYAH